MSNLAELSALATSLGDLVDRLAQIADDLTGAERDRIGQDLFEVERTLTTAKRRLDRVLSAYPPGSTG
ncbi:MAG: hypothetical protein M3063_13335 [Actinomycetota bacterium]|nr:hypothetical protein [Actinomycetota bacterium]MDQ6944877.1 hypothetical protein [Actinomycetota bacterium]